METKFTKGEWKIERLNPTDDDICVCVGDELISVLYEHADVNKCYANAKLIASAPELLGVAIKCLEWCNSVKSIEFVNDLRNEAEAAIKKATE